MKIRTRLLVFNIALMIVTVVTMGGTFYVFGEQYLHRSAIDEISRSSRQALLIVERFFDTRIAEQRTLSKSTFFFRNLNYEQIQMRFEDYRHNFQTYHTISFFDAKRIRRIDLNRLDLEKRAPSDRLFDRALAANGPIYEFDVSNPMRPLVHFVSKVQQGREPPVGYVLATVPLTNLQRTLIALAQPVAVRNRADVQLFARDGSRIYSRLEASGVGAALPIVSKNFTKKPIRLSEGAFAGDGSSYEGLLYETSDEFSIVFERGADQNDLNSWKLAFRVAKADLERPIILLRKMMIAIFVALFLIAIALNRWLTQSLLIPIENLTASMESYNMGTVETTIDDMKRNDEIGVLTRGVHDLTERMKTNFAELSTTSKFVALGEMAAGIAHEINNPLTPIQLSAERLLMKLDGKVQAPEQAILNKSVRTIVDQVDAMKRLVNEFRDYARLPAAQLAPVDLNALVRDIVVLYDNATVPVQLDLADHLPMAQADVQQVRQTLHNLVQNAQDAMVGIPGAQVVLRTRRSDSGQWVRLSVLDQGPGFAEHILKRAFEPYVTTKVKGTGLGLAVVKKIMDEHGGRVDLSNRLTEGKVIGAQVSLSFAVAI